MGFPLGWAWLVEHVRVAGIVVRRDGRAAAAVTGVRARAGRRRTESDHQGLVGLDRTRTALEELRLVVEAGRRRRVAFGTDRVPVGREVGVVLRERRGLHLVHEERALAGDDAG